MKISYHEGKRALTLAERGLDFADAAKVLDGPTFTLEDDRKEYGEVRYQTIGWSDRSVVMVMWTQRGDARHIISMRKCNEREKRKCEFRMG